MTSSREDSRSSGYNEFLRCFEMLYSGLLGRFESARKTSFTQYHNLLKTILFARLWRQLYGDKNWLHINAKLKEIKYTSDSASVKEAKNRLKCVCNFLRHKCICSQSYDKPKSINAFFQAYYRFGSSKKCEIVSNSLLDFKGRRRDKSSLHILGLCHSFL